KRDGAQLVAKGRHAFDLGDILVVMNGEKTEPHARAIDAVGNDHRQRAEEEAKRVDRPRLRAEELGHRYADEIDAGAAVDRGIRDDRRDDEGDRDRDQCEKLAAKPLQAEDEPPDAGSEGCGEQARSRDRPEERPVELRRQSGGGIDAGAEEGGMAEAPIAGEPAEDRPARRHRDPEEDKIEEGDVVSGDTGRRNDEHERGHHDEAGNDADAVPGQIHRGLNNKRAIRTEKETSGAQDGLITAMVSASQTPMSTPPISAPIGLPRRPMITTAKTTPTHAQICDGAKVAISAMNTPA